MKKPLAGLPKKSAFWLLLLFMTACASDIGLMKKSDLDTLKQDSTQTKRDIDDLRRSLYSVQSEVADLKGKLPEEKSLVALRDSQASLFSQVSELLREVQVLNGRFDENKYFMDRYLKETSTDIEVIKSRLDSISAAVDRAGIEAVRARLQSIDAELTRLKERLSAVETAKEAERKEAAPKKATPEEAYRAALNTFKNKKYSETRQKMETFLRDFPEHNLAGNARFWIGETYYAEKDFDDAILTYEEVLQKHGDNPKVPAAMLKQAYAFLELKDKKAARGILKELIERYPESEQAKAAKEKLKKLSD